MSPLSNINAIKARLLDRLIREHFREYNGYLSWPYRGDTNLGDIDPELERELIQIYKPNSLSGA
jgi:hypothetical protein